jgi:hypothetical protein
LTSPTSVDGTPGSPSVPPRGPAIEVSDIGGGHSKVSDSASEGDRHRRLRHRWWVLPSLHQHLPGGAVINVSDIGGGRSRVSSSVSLVARHAFAAPVSSQPPPRWAQGPLSVSCRLGTLTYRLQVKTSSRACIHILSCVLQLRTSPPLLRWLLAVPSVLQLRTSPPCQGGLQHSHVSHGPGPCLTTEVGPSAATCSVALGLSSQPRQNPALTRVQRL